MDDVGKRTDLKLSYSERRNDCALIETYALPLRQTASLNKNGVSVKFRMAIIYDRKNPSSIAVLLVCKGDAGCSPGVA